VVHRLGDGNMQKQWSLETVIVDGDSVGGVSTVRIVWIIIEFRSP
jgi:hypothetical protein